MTQETVKALSDAELTQVVAWAQTEIKARAEKRKQETIAKIKELAGAVGISIAIGRDRGQSVQPALKTKIGKTSRSSQAQEER